MRIALVEDSAPERAALRRQLLAQLARLGWQAEILEFESGAAFLDAARAQRFALAFLDIYLKGSNGMDAARALRRFDTDCELVFITSSADFALDGFRVRALHYLVKPCSGAELAALFDELHARLPVPDPCLCVPAPGGTVRLPYRSILYAEHFQHRIHIYTVGGGETVTRQTFREFARQLEDSRFFLCSRGVAVNLEHAADFDGAAFLLTNGTRVPVSRDLARAAREALGDYLFERGRGV